MTFVALIVIFALTLDEVRAYLRTSLELLGDLVQPTRVDFFALSSELTGTLQIIGAEFFPTLSAYCWASFPFNFFIVVILFVVLLVIVFFFVVLLILSFLLLQDWLAWKLVLLPFVQLLLRWLLLGLLKLLSKATLFLLLKALLVPLLESASALDRWLSW